MDFLTQLRLAGIPARRLSFQAVATRRGWKIGSMPIPCIVSQGRAATWYMKPTTRDATLNWAQERNRIDRGLAGDKVNYPDPAVSPLGTDEEAGGETTPPETIATAAESYPSPTIDRAPRAPVVVLVALFMLIAATGVAVAVIG